VFCSTSYKQSSTLVFIGPINIISGSSLFP